MGNSRSSQALQEENISQIEADTGCEFFKKVFFANDLDSILIVFNSYWQSN